jgi:hypothetical protein
VGALCLQDNFVCKQLQLLSQGGDDSTTTGIGGDTELDPSSVRLLAGTGDANVPFAASLGHCVAEMEFCAMDTRCLTLLAKGVNSLANPSLWALWTCLYAQEGSSVDSGRLAALAFSATSDDDASVDIVAECIREYCYAEYVRCERSVECFTSNTDPLRTQLQRCVDSRCYLDSINLQVSTLAPTVAPTNVGGLMERVGLHALTPYEIRDIAYQEVILGRKGMVPEEGVTAALFLHIPCDFPIDNDGIDQYTGKIALFDRGLHAWTLPSCNIYDALRMLAQRGVVGALIVNEEEGTNGAAATWVGRDMNLNMFVLGIEQSSANSLRALLRRYLDGAIMRLKGPPNTCDTAHVSGVFIPGIGEHADANSCCVASDVVLSKIMYDFDYWELGVRLSPFCPVGTDAVPSSCILLTDVLDDAEMCHVDSKVNGICEDGGHNATVALTGYGMDCGDCGRRTPTAHTHGYPSDASFTAAKKILCERRDCEDALVLRYDAYFESNNFFSKRLRSFCSEVKCSIPGLLREYDLSDSNLSPSCCVAARVAVAALAFQTLANLVTLPMLPETLCPEGESLYVGGTTATRVSCRVHMHGMLEVHLPSPKSIAAAKNHLCNHGLQNSEDTTCITSVAENMLRELILMDRVSGPVDVAFERDVIGHMDIRTALCDDVPLEVCWASDTFFYSMPASTVSGSSELDEVSEPMLSCCDASHVLLHELRWQGALDQRDGTLDADICHGPLNLIAMWETATLSNICDNYGKVNTQLLKISKDVVWQAENGACRASFLKLVEGGNAGMPRLLKAPAAVDFEASPFWTMEACWLSASLGLTVPIPEAEDRVCAAFNALLSRTAWLDDEKLGNLYFAECPRSADGLSVSCLEGLPIPDERTIKEASDILCSATHLRAVLASGIDEQLQQLPHTSWQWPGLSDYCHDPCRCVEECGFHGAQHEQAYCQVQDSLACPRAYLEEEMGRSRAHCPLGHDTCQEFWPEPGATCSPFVSEGSSVFVPRGKTIEMLQQISISANADLALAGAIFGSESDDTDVLRAWMLEAALVSVTCFRTHGQLLCDSILKRCVLSDDADAWVTHTAVGALPWSAESRQALIDASTPVVKVCKADCERAIAFDTQMCGDDVVYNSLLFAAARKTTTAMAVEPAALADKICGMKIDPMRMLECSGLGGNNSYCEGSTTDLYGIYGGTVVHSMWELGNGLFTPSRLEDGDAAPPCQSSMAWATAPSPVSLNMSSAPSSKHAGIGYANQFNTSRALEFISCPAPWIKHHRVDMAQLGASLKTLQLGWTEGMGNVESQLSVEAYFNNRLCLAPCPSGVYSNREYSWMWLCYVIPGLVAFVWNFAALSEMAWADGGYWWHKKASRVGLEDTLANSGNSSNKSSNNGSNVFDSSTESSKITSSEKVDAVAAPTKASNSSATIIRKPPPKVSTETRMLILMASLYGIVGVFPTLLLREALPCGDCGTEKCFVETGASSPWCIINRSSTFILQIILNCVLWKTALLTISINFSGTIGARRLSRIKRFFGVASVGVPVVLCLVAYLLEDTDPRHERFPLHLARSSVFCRMRLSSNLEEFVLVYFPMIISMAAVSVCLITTLKSVIGAYIRMRVGTNAATYFRSNPKAMLNCTVKAVLDKPQLFYLVKLAAAVIGQCIFLVAITGATAPTLSAFQSESDSWLKCIRYRYARESLFGDVEEWTDATGSSDGTDSPCPAFPTERPSVFLMCCGVLSEAFVPLTIALFFSLKKRWGLIFRQRLGMGSRGTGLFTMITRKSKKMSKKVLITHIAALPEVVSTQNQEGPLPQLPTNRALEAAQAVTSSKELFKESSKVKKMDSLLHRQSDVEISDM